MCCSKDAGKSNAPPINDVGLMLRGGIVERKIALRAPYAVYRFPYDASQTRKQTCIDEP
jgi:hypothetical protein